VTVTPTGVPAPPPENKEDSPKPQTEEQRQQEQRTNRSGKDDVHTEGNVLAVECERSASWRSCWPACPSWFDRPTPYWCRR
jgi:hypothetical protein